MLYIEDTLIKIDLVNELSVVSIEDSFWGNKILVFYVKPQKISETSVKEQFIKFSKKHLTTIEMPDEYICLKKMPKTSIGKIKKQQLVDTYLNKLKFLQNY